MKKFLRCSVLAMVLTTICLFSAQSKQVNTVNALSAIPGGYTVGLKLYLDGLLVIGSSDIKTSHGSMCPGKIAGVVKGERITKINGEEIEGVSQFCREIQESNGSKIKLEVKNGESAREVFVTPALYSETGEYKIGLWVRDSTSGIGTVTFILSDGTFGALGHGINDVDTKALVKVKKGEVSGSSICSVLKGTVGKPGDLRGIFNSDFSGTVEKNTNQGIFGNLSGGAKGEAVEVAKKEDVKVGEAVILANVDGKNVKEYAVEIESLSPFLGKNDKNMVIRITDENLLGKTGGIVQGMSGSPLIQNGKLIGAVTHVFVNDPTRGYGIFIENMLAEAEKIK